MALSNAEMAEIYLVNTRQGLIVWLARQLVPSFVSGHR